MGWAPHHAIGDNWFNFSTFPKNYLQMLAFARKTDYEIVLRPHPALFNNVVDCGALTKSELNGFLEAWQSLPNTSLSVDEDYAALFRDSDAMVTDGISFLASYQLTGKPLIWTVNPGHMPFTALGNKMVESVYQLPGDDVSGLPDLLDKLFASPSHDLLKEKRTAFAEQYLYRDGEKPSKNIIDAILNEYYGPVVHPSIYPIDTSFYSGYSNFKMHKYRLMMNITSGEKSRHYRDKFLRLHSLSALKAAAEAAPGNRNSPIRKRIFVDITRVAANPSHITGVERVASSLLDTLQKHYTDSFDVIPVYFTPLGFKAANRYLSFQSDMDYGDDVFVSYTKDDVFLGLDLMVEESCYPTVFESLSRQGVSIFYFLHDLLPVTHPHYMTARLQNLFVPWLHFISKFNGVITSTKAVADQYLDWRRDNGYADAGFKVVFSHLGADGIPEHQDSEIPEDTGGVFEAMAVRQTVLMVSTVEPRKGYQQALAAFEQLWSEGVDANLVIVGWRGWYMDDFFITLDTHPERGKRLFWFSGISDAFLARLYEQASGILMASEGEVFGLSIIEGADYGKPLLLRDIPVFREVAGDNATYFTGLDADSLSKALSDWLAGIRLGQVKPPVRINRSTWLECAQRILAGIGI